MKQKIRISLKSFDHYLIENSVEKIINALKTTGSIVKGPIPMPTKKSVYTVLRSPFVNKKSREQFQSCVYKRVIDIHPNTASASNGKAVDELMKLELPSGVDVEIKV